MHGMAGPGGSLGQCQVCGEAFVMEVLLGRNIRSISMPLIKEDLAVHEDCIPVLTAAQEDGWESLPEGPIRRVYAAAVEHNRKLEE